MKNYRVGSNVHVRVVHRYIKKVRCSDGCMDARRLDSYRTRWGFVSGNGFRHFSKSVKKSFVFNVFCTEYYLY